ncbi:MAG: DUF2254 domain-containing protein [Blastomonas sp.]|nr:DUF2254 domain-containing protein [Blastomonas sp.]
MTLPHARLLARRIFRSLWFTPAAYALLAVAALLLAPSAGRLLPDEFNELIGLDGVDDLLDVLASSLLAVAIFSLGIMVSSLQAAASAATPRARPLLMQDRTAQNAISVFIGGFIYAIVGTVGLATSFFGAPARVILFMTTCLVIVSVIYALLRWIGRLSNLGDVSEVVDLLENAADNAFAELAQRPLLGGVALDAMPDHGVPLRAERFGFVQAIDDALFSTISAEQDMDFYLAVRPGTYVDSTTILLKTSRALDEETTRSVRSAFVIGGDRTFEADPRYCLIVLSETASKALSAGINDPGTAIDVLGTALRVLAKWSSKAREAVPSVTCPRLHVPPVSVEDMVGDAFRWIARDGAGQLEVQIRLQKALQSLAAHDPAHFGEAARAMSHEAFARAKIGLALPADVETLERFVLK